MGGLANISTIDGSTLLNEFRVCGGLRRGFLIGEVRRVAGGDWPRLPFCCRIFFFLLSSLVTAALLLAEPIFAARALRRRQKRLVLAESCGAMWRGLAWSA